MASMKMCKPAYEATYSETEKVKCNSDSQGYQSGEHKHHEHSSVEYSKNENYHMGVGHQLGGGMKHSSHNTNYNQGGYMSDHKHHEHKSSGCGTKQGGHNMGSMVHKQPNHGYSTGHHSLTEKISECFSHKGSSHDQHHGSSHGHQHGSSHGHQHGYSHGHQHGSNHDQHHGSGHDHHHSSSHHESYGYEEKKEEHKSCKSGHVKSEIKIKKKTSYKSSDDESDDEGCKKRC